MNHADRYARAVAAIQAKFPQPQPQPPVGVVELPDGFACTVLVVAAMRRAVRAALRDERVNLLARLLTEDVPTRDARGEAQRILEVLQPAGGVFRYTHLPWDPQGFQRLQTPSYTLFDSPARSGECASLTAAYAALVMSLGHEARFRTAGRDPRDEWNFGHVYALDDVVGAAGGAFVAADPSYDFPLGWPHLADGRADPSTPVRTWLDWLI